MTTLKLDQNIPPTQSYNEIHLKALGLTPSAISEGTPEGPFLGNNFHENAPLRAKITGPHEPGKVLVIKGRVWANDSREPLPHTKMDIWQANADGLYGVEDQHEFINRARVYSDQDGYYEFETIHPGPYQVEVSGSVFWRAPHIHFRVRCPEYERLVTQLFFAGDPYHETDLFLIPSLVIQLSQKERYGKLYEEGIFDIVLREIDSH